MITPPIKALAAAGAKRGQFELTVANGLPDELSRLPERDAFSGANSFLKRRKSPLHGIRGEKGGRSKNVAAISKSRPCAVATTIAFADDGHPTVLAATCG